MRPPITKYAEIKLNAKLSDLFSLHQDRKDERDKNTCISEAGMSPIVVVFRVV